MTGAGADCRDSPIGGGTEEVPHPRWSENQPVVLDNRITQHYAIDNYDGLPRRLRRVTAAGAAPAAAA